MSENTIYNVVSALLGGNKMQATNIHNCIYEALTIVVVCNCPQILYSLYIMTIITFSHDMKWSDHIDSIIQKAFSRLNGIRRLKQVLSRKVKETLYKSLVLPIVEYGSVLFDNCSAALKLRLERLHRNAAVIITGAFKITSFVKLLDELGWNSLEDRRKLARLTLFKKITISTHAHKENRPNDTLVPEYLHSLVPHTVGDRAGYVLRNAGKLDIVKTRLVASYNSFIPKTTREWNTLMSTDNVCNSNIQKALTTESFKACYKREFFRTPNPLYKIENEHGNMHQTRLRLGLSHLSSIVNNRRAANYE